jgi:hypothetical protein
MGTFMMRMNPPATRMNPPATRMNRPTAKMREPNAKMDEPIANVDAVVLDGRRGRLEDTRAYPEGRPGRLGLDPT